MGFEDEAEQSLGRPCRSDERQVQADMRTHLIHRPARDIIPPLGGAARFGTAPHRQALRGGSYNQAIRWLSRKARNRAGKYPPERVQARTNPRHRDFLSRHGDDFRKDTLPKSGPASRACPCAASDLRGCAAFGSQPNRSIRIQHAL
jgi:hypothetical protein